MNRPRSSLLSRATLALALLGAVAVATPALARGPSRGPGDPEMKTARLQLHSAILVAKLELSPEQKSALKKILGQARQLRDQHRNDPALAQHKAKAKALLAKATAEARANGGEVSVDTRAQLEALRSERKPERTEMRGTMRELMESARNVLTPEQQQQLQQMGPGARGPRGGQGFGPGAGRGPGPGFGAGPCQDDPEACEADDRGPRHLGAREGRGGRGEGPGARGPRGKERGKKMMHLLLSDEFIAELGR